MSNTQYAFLKKGNVPSRTMLQEAVDALGFDLKLHPELNLAQDEGFSPCVFYGVEDVGFELFVESVEEMLEDDEDGRMQEMVGENDFCVSMSWRGSMKDCASVMIVSCALAKSCGAVISFEGDDPEPVEKLMSATNAIVAEARKQD